MAAGFPNSKEVAIEKSARIESSPCQSMRCSDTRSNCPLPFRQLVVLTGTRRTGNGCAGWTHEGMAAVLGNGLLLDVGRRLRPSRQIESEIQSGIKVLRSVQ